MRAVPSPVVWPLVGAAAARESGVRGRVAKWFAVAAAAASRRLALPAVGPTAAERAGGRGVAAVGDGGGDFDLGVCVATTAAPIGPPRFLVGPLVDDVCELPGAAGPIGGFGGVAPYAVGKRGLGGVRRRPRPPSSFEDLVGLDLCIGGAAAARGVEPAAVVESPRSSSAPDEIPPPVAWPPAGAAAARGSGVRGRAAKWLAAAAVASSRRLALAVFVVVLAPAEASGVFTDRAGLKAAVDDLATAEATHGPIAGWDVSRVDDMSSLFQNKVACNSDVSKWDTSKVTSLEYTFNGAWAFNQPLVWDTSSVTTLQRTFGSATAFDRPLEWGTSKVTSMYQTFHAAAAFDQALDWDMSKVTTMYYTFREAKAFNQALDCRASSTTSCAALGSTLSRSRASCCSPGLPSSSSREA